MDWKDRLNQAASALGSVADSETVRNLTAKAKQAASGLTQRARQGVLSAADAYVEANADPTSLRIRYFNAEVTILSPSDGLQLSRPHAGALVISDGAGNGLVVGVGDEKARVTETVGAVKLLNDSTFDLGEQDGVNVIVLKT